MNIRNSILVIKHRLRLMGMELDLMNDNSSYDEIDRLIDDWVLIGKYLREIKMNMNVSDDIYNQPVGTPINFSYDIDK